MQKLVDALQAEKAFHVVTKFGNPNQPAALLVEADLRVR